MVSPATWTMSDRERDLGTVRQPRLLLRRPRDFVMSAKIDMALSTCEGRASRAAAAQRFPQMETFYDECFRMVSPATWTMSDRERDLGTVEGFR